MHPFDTLVTALIRSVAAQVILPRFRTLAAHEVEEKAPGDLVTIADSESEVRLAQGLAKIDPEARIVGEEATALDPSLRDRVAEGRVWLIDPIDGTHNFAEGIRPFGVMVALLEEGEPLAGWIYDPVEDRMCHGARGIGAFVDGERVQAHGSGEPLPVTTLPGHYMSPERCADLIERSRGVLKILESPRCAAEQYARLVLGENDAAVYERSHPWDHAAGTVFLHEAGGVVRRLDGAPYIIGEHRHGLLAAATPAIWETAAKALFESPGLWQSCDFWNCQMVVETIE